MKNKYNFYSKIEKCLVGKELTAFGKDGQGLWGYDLEKTHKFGVEELNIKGEGDSILISVQQLNIKKLMVIFTLMKLLLRM